MFPFEQNSIHGHSNRTVFTGFGSAGKGLGECGSEGIFFGHIEGWRNQAWVLKNSHAESSSSVVDEFRTRGFAVCTKIQGVEEAYATIALQRFDKMMT
jgi:hypothetical protein